MSVLFRINNNNKGDNMSKLKPRNPNLVRKLLKLSDRELRVMMYENSKGKRRSHKNPHLRAMAIQKVGI